MLTYVLPTRNRPETLARTVEALGRLPAHRAELIVVDNASDLPPRLPIELPNGIRVHLIFRYRNEGAAARNHGVLASDPSSEWIVMLDDDSCPLDTGHLAALADQPGDVAAVGAEITLANGTREAGGLPEVFTGCGVALRRSAFIHAGGYDETFHYYVEEYDLAAKLLLHGWRVVLDRRFRVRHEKIEAGRDMNLILRRLVRNNAWVAQRYAPEERRRAELKEISTRYAAIATREHALPGFIAGSGEALSTLSRQRRSAMSPALFDRFTGLAEARRSVGEAYDLAPFKTAAVVEEGKNGRFVRQALHERGVLLVPESAAEALVIGTLSPGPLLDAWERLSTRGGPRLLSPWRSLVQPVTARLSSAA